MHAVLKFSLALTHQRLFYHASHLYQSLHIHGSSHSTRGDSKQFVFELLMNLKSLYYKNIITGRTPNRLVITIDTQDKSTMIYTDHISSGRQHHSEKGQLKCT